MARWLLSRGFLRGFWPDTIFNTTFSHEQFAARTELRRLTASSLNVIAQLAVRFSKCFSRFRCRLTIFSRCVYVSLSRNFAETSQSRK